MCKNDFFMTTLFSRATQCAILWFQRYSSTTYCWEGSGAMIGFGGYIYEILYFVGKINDQPKEKSLINLIISYTKTQSKLTENHKKLGWRWVHIINCAHFCSRTREGRRNRDYVYFVHARWTVRERSRRFDIVSRPRIGFRKRLHKI